MKGKGKDFKISLNRGQITGFKDLIYWHRKRKKKKAEKQLVQTLAPCKTESFQGSHPRKDRDLTGTMSHINNRNH